MATKKSSAKNSNSASKAKKSKVKKVADATKAEAIVNVKATEAVNSENKASEKPAASVKKETISAGIDTLASTVLDAVVAKKMDAATAKDINDPTKGVDTTQAKRTNTAQDKDVDALTATVINAIAAKSANALATKGEATVAVKGENSVAVKGENSVAVKGDDSVAVKGEDSVAVKGENSVAVKGEASVAVKGDDSVAIKDSTPPAVKVEGIIVASTAAVKIAAKPQAIHTEINPYLPDIATVTEVIRETHNIVTLRVVIDDKARMDNFTHQAGQVGQLSLFGVGEATFVINSPPSCKDYLQFSVMSTGEVTKAIHKLSPGDKIGVRAPLGSSFPWEDWKGKDIFFVGGGIGMAPIRTIMLQILEHSKDFGKISLLYGARSPLDMAFSYELDDWMSRKDLDCTLTIDAPYEGWKHKVGLIPNILLELAPDPAKSIAVLCGPPIMIKFTVQALEKLKFADDTIFTTLERRMKCGIGLCGRCNLGGKYICVDGPVYTWAELKNLPPEL